jgi:hypothetical protein
MTFVILVQQIGEDLRNLLLVINDQYPGLYIVLHLFSPEIDTTAASAWLNSITLGGHLGGYRKLPGGPVTGQSILDDFHKCGKHVFTLA